jgi:DNA polymerase-3 subunit delta
MTKAPATFYIFHGDDDFTLEQEVAKFRAKMDGPNASLNTSEFDGESASVPEIISAASSYPFLADKRMIIVKGLLSWITRKGAGESGKKAAEQLTDALPALPEWARVVFIERQMLSETNRFVKLAREHGYEKAFTAPQDATNWITKRAQDAYSAQIEPAAATALASVTQNDLRRADNELAKLASYVDNARPISEDDVALLTPYLAEARGFDMVDAMTQGRARDALAMLHRLLMEKEEDPFRVYGLIIRQFRLLLLAKEHLTAGGNPGNLAAALGLKPYPAQKAAQQARNFTLEQLERIYRRLLEYDIEMKTGRIKPEIALDLLIASLER